MYASIRTYRCDPSQMDELLGAVDSDFIPLVSDHDGFCGYQAIDCGEGTLVTVSCFTGQDEAEASADTAAKFISEKLSDYEIERTDVKAGAVRVSVAAQEMLEPAHV